MPGATYSLHCKRPQLQCFTEHSFFILEQSSSGNSNIVTVCTAHQWNKTFSERIVRIQMNFKSNIQSTCIEKNYRAEERCVGERSVEKRKKTRLLFLWNSGIRIFRSQSDATRKGFEFTAKILKCSLKWVVLFLFHRSPHQMLGSKCAFCTYRDHSYRSSTSNFMAHREQTSWRSIHGLQDSHNIQ